MFQFLLFCKIASYEWSAPLMSAEQTINDKLQGSVAAYLRCGGVVNNEIRKGSLLTESEFFNRWIVFGNVTSKSVVVSCSLRAWPKQYQKTKKVHETITFLLVTSVISVMVFQLQFQLKLLISVFFQLQLLFFSFSYLTPNTNTDRTHVAYSLLRRTCIFFNCNTGVA